MNCVLGRLYQRCDAKVCKCPKGREHHLNGSKFEIVRCEVRRMKMLNILKAFRVEFSQNQKSFMLMNLLLVLWVRWNSHLMWKLVKAISIIHMR